VKEIANIVGNYSAVARNLEVPVSSILSATNSDSAVKAILLLFIRQTCQLMYCTKPLFVKSFLEACKYGSVDKF
jgi:hypothetical protein